MVSPATRANLKWGLVWQSKNPVDGVVRHLVHGEVGWWPSPDRPDGKSKGHKFMPPLAHPIHARGKEKST